MTDIAATPKATSPDGGLSDQTLNAMSLALLVIGIIWRVTRYIMCYPIWGDEALLAVNFVWYDYGALLSRLENCQIAPILFLWGERAVLVSLGPSEYALRLLPIVAGVGSLGLLWWLSGLLLTPHARLFAVGILAIAKNPVVLCNQVKPYSLDLFFGLLLTVLAVKWSQQPTRRYWLVALVLLVPWAILGSYPAAFIAGGISLALLPSIRHQVWSVRCLYLAMLVGMLVSFMGVLLIARNHLNSPLKSGTTQTEMKVVWEGGFPPDSFVGWPWWLYRQTAGPITALPVGGSNGASTATFLLAIGGVWWWGRQRCWTTLRILLMPLGLTLVAAILHRYPYGEHARLMQHLGAAVCVLAGLGLSTFVTTCIRAPRWRGRWTSLLWVIFVVVGIAGTIRDIRRPHTMHNSQGAWAQVTLAMIRQEAPTAPVVLCSNQHHMDQVVVWYWLTRGEPMTSDFELPSTRDTDDQIYGFYIGEQADAALVRLQHSLQQHDSAWQLKEHRALPPFPPVPEHGPVPCALFHFVRPSRR